MYTQYREQPRYSCFYLYSTVFMVEENRFPLNTSIMSSHIYDIRTEPLDLCWTHAEL